MEQEQEQEPEEEEEEVSLLGKEDRVKKDGSPFPQNVQAMKAEENSSGNRVVVGSC